MSCAIVPSTTSEDVPLPEKIVTPLSPAVAFSVPSTTVSVTRSTPPSASTSFTERLAFFRLRLVCSVAL